MQGRLFLKFRVLLSSPIPYEWSSSSAHFFLSERFSDIYELDYDEEPIVEQSVRNTAPVSLC